MKQFILAVVVLLISISPRMAMADEWGCEVLLCAASSAPSWRGVPECHPPMERLIAAMKKPGFSWPTCPEGGAGKPGYEPFEDCPAGWLPTEGEDAGDGYFRAGQSRCMRLGSDCRGANFRTKEGRGENEITRVFRSEQACDYTEYMTRPRRAQPYFFDIQDQTSSTSMRYYFDLH